MGNIKNIIFDLGGVVIDLDRQRAIRALENLGIAEAPLLLDEYEQKGPFLMLETGKLTVAQLCDTLMPCCPAGTTATAICDAFEEFLVDLPKERLEAIRSLREAGFKVFVLSNTNPIMYNHWIDDAFRKEGMTINDYFDGIVVSFQEHTCKPDPQIFRNLINRYRLNEKETLLLDDSKANCESARSIGLNAVQVKKEGEDSILNICLRLKEEGVAK